VTGELDGLDKAVQALGDALEITPETSVDIPAWSANLASVLRERFRSTGSLPDLDRAIALFERAAGRSPVPSPHRAAYLNNLGNALRDRFGAAGRPEDLDAAISTLETAANDGASGVWHHDTVATNLAEALLDRYRASGAVADLHRSAALIGRVGETGTDGPRRLVTRGLVLAERFDSSGDPRDQARAEKAFKAGCESGLQLDPDVALHGGRLWGAWSARWHRWSESARAYGFALDALAATVRRQLFREHKESWLGTAVGLSAQAAYSLHAAGDTQGAVMAVETGRAVLLGEALGRSRADIRRLSRDRPDLGASFRTALQRLGALERQAASARDEL
jgi:hypothetical protein